MGYKAKLTVKKAIQKRNISQKQLANMAGIRESTISEICRGTKTSINLVHLSKIASALNISNIKELIVLESGHDEYGYDDLDDL